jgi:hypothetical protein
MKLVAMQPYFFPYLGYFDLANQADLWIVYDDSQYIRHGWVNRNRILHPHGGWQYVIVPLEKHPHSTPISRIRASARINWKAAIFKQLLHYENKAPYYRPVIAFLREGLSEPEDNLSSLNTKLFRSTCRLLGIDTPIRPFSDLNLPGLPVGRPEDLALAICRAAGADEYINRPGGAGLYDEKRFLEHRLKLTIQTYASFIYDCGRYPFIPDLSIIDVLMWNSPEQIKRYLDTGRVERGRNSGG